ncbi:MAG: carbohydrate porin [bacterium]
MTHPMTPSRTAPRPTTHRAAIIASAILLAAQTTLAQTPTTPAPTPAVTAPSIKLTTLAPSIPDNLYDEVYTPTSPTEELDDISQPVTPSIDSQSFDSPFQALLDKRRSLQEATGLRLGFAYTMVFQQASAGPNSRTGTSGDIDFISDWTLIGRGTADTGRLVFTTEYRFKAGSDPASALRRNIGSLTATTGGFNDRGWVVRDAFWEQRLLEDHLRIQLGRSDISDYFGGYRLQSINNSFSNRAFSALATAPSPGHGMGALITLRPASVCYLTLAANNAYGRTTQSDFSSLGENWDLFYAVEAGYTPTIEGMGRGRYAVAFWHVDARTDPNIPQDQGFTVIAEQDLNKTLYAFARYQYADTALENIDYSVQLGLGVNGLLGSPDNLTAIAYSYAEPATDGQRDEKVVEAFHRWQLTRFTQFSLGMQGIFDPSNAPDDNALAVFTARFRIAF